MLFFWGAGKASKPSKTVLREIFLQENACFTRTVKVTTFGLRTRKNRPNLPDGWSAGFCGVE